MSFLLVKAPLKFLLVWCETAVVFLLMFSNPKPLNRIFSLGNKKKSHETRDGLVSMESAVLAQFCGVFFYKN